MTVVNIPLKYIFLAREESGIFIVYNPRSKRIMKQWSPFSNGDAVFIYKDINEVIPNLMMKDWEIKEQGDY